MDAEFLQKILATAPPSRSTTNPTTFEAVYAVLSFGAGVVVIPFMLNNLALPISRCWAILSGHGFEPINDRYYDSA